MTLSLADVHSLGYGGHHSDARGRVERGETRRTSRTICAIAEGYGFQLCSEFGSDGAGRAGNGDNGIVLHFGPHRAIKKPRTF